MILFCSSGCSQGLHILTVQAFEAKHLSSADEGGANQLSQQSTSLGCPQLVYQRSLGDSATNLKHNSDISLLGKVALVGVFA